MNARDRREGCVVAAASRARTDAAPAMAARAGAVDWERVAQDLDAGGSAVVERLLTRAECEALAALYPAAGSLSQPGGDGAARLRAR